MKQISLLFAAVVPFAAVAAGSQSATVDQQQLENAIPATQLIGQNVQTSDGREFGEIQAIAFKKDGSVAYYEIEPDMELYGQASSDAGSSRANDADSMSASASASAGSEQVGVDAGTADVDADVDVDADSETVSGESMDARSDDDNSIRVKAENITIEQGGEMVSVSMDRQSLAQQSSSSMSDSESAITSDELIGMEVDLADEESFGAVEDVMLNEQGDKAVALVVDNWDGANKERRAMKVELESANTDEVIRYDVSSDQLGEDGNFDLDRYTDDM